jgi:hypothetical protein
MLISNRIQIGWFDRFDIVSDSIQPVRYQTEHRVGLKVGSIRSPINLTGLAV